MTVQETEQLTTDSVVSPVYAPNTDEILRILTVNALLTIVTLGIYRFWGKTRIRRYVWSRLRVLDEPFEYSGTAKELFIGFLIVLAVLAPLLIAKTLAETYWIETTLGQDRLIEEAALGAFSVTVFLFLLQFAVYRARRYRLTRTRWCGIVGAQSGSALKYAMIFFGTMLLTVLTLGLCFPVMSTALERYRISNTWLGNARFEFSGRAGALMKRWPLYWALLIPTFGLSYIWYRAAETRYFASQTTLDSFTFASRITGTKIFGVYLIYWIFLAGSITLILVFLGLISTLVGLAVLLARTAMGLGSGDLNFSLDGLLGDSVILSEAMAVLPFAFGIIFVILTGVLYTLLVMNRLLKLFCETLEVTGTMDLDTLAQGDLAAPSRGEGLADALDIGGL